MDFNSRLRAARKSRGLTQMEIAARLGIKQSSVSAWELGKSEPEYCNLVALARVLGVTTDYLLGHEGGEELPADIAATIGGLVESVENGGALVDGDALTPEAAAVATPMLKGTLSATRSAQRDAKRGSNLSSDEKKRSKGESYGRQ